MSLAEQRVEHWQGLLWQAQVTLETARRDPDDLRRQQRVTRGEAAVAQARERLAAWQRRLG